MSKQNEEEKKNQFLSTGLSDCSKPKDSLFPDTNDKENMQKKHGDIWGKKLNV